MATADEYAGWIVANQAKKGTPEFDTVARAYQEAKNDAPQEPAKKERSVTDSIGRQLGLTLRAGVEGITALPNMFGNAFGLRSSEAVSKGLTRIGVPEPANAIERVANTVAGAMAGAGGQAKLAGLAAQGSTGAGRLIAEKLAEGPGMQIASSASGSGGGAVAKEQGVGPGGQMLATIAGGMAPAVIQAGGSAAVRGLLRGGEEGRLKTAENLKTFADAGTTPTVGQATESRSSRLAETMMGKTPGSAGVMANKAKQEAQDIGGRVGEMADSLSLKAGAAPAGREIKQGIEGAGGFIENFKAKQAALYDNLDKYIAPDTQVPAVNALAKINELTKPIAGAKETSALLQTPKIGTIGTALAKDAGAKPSQPILSSLLGPDGKLIVQGHTLAQPGGIPYQALKELRTAVGAKITNPSMMDDIPTGQWKQLYGALSEDLRGAAKAAGPEAETAFNRANAFTKAGHARIENVLQPIIKKADPEDIFRAATSGMQEGATTIQGVMKSIPDKSRRAVSATVLNRMGLAQAGKQDATGEIFSPETFLTNWNKMSPDAKTTLFSRYGLDFNKNLDQVAKVTANLREGNKIFANPSGTEAAMTSKLGIAGIIWGLLFGHPASSVALAGGMGASHVGAKYLMTNPAFVGWLAQTTTVPKGSLAAQIDVLEQLAEKQPKNERDAMRKFAADLKGRK